MKIGIIGEKKSVLAFQPLGIQTFGVTSKEDLEIGLETIKSEDFAVVFVTEDIMQKYESEIEPLLKNILPAILVVPGVKAGGQKGRECLKKIMERALGSEIIGA
ncbi:hypothetical protein COT20_00610 [bacterium (Candidatus Gribaldobacteria) CG08_land_8_20_14_0_20_39_15]|uniref:V-type ATP synthase subunit F n=1 Tax=bacterium (Candidatus Gribaldobacteria) CG08_land_8_20_14_0_20_39_15 TaxID=2014273 RepID=A0A2M6XV51_9BACT|nr:MAG: hypothetical protein COT20_00610 [bacterium (Candidatus Gribaldobacteria) CG08_land_8_20_14_0_20_39_15]